MKNKVIEESGHSKLPEKERVSWKESSFFKGFCYGAVFFFFALVGLFVFCVLFARGIIVI